jgi:hypothetical protein
VPQNSTTARPAVCCSLFCYPKYRERLFPVTAGFLLPIVIFGAVDWITWSYPWHSYIGNFHANIVMGIGAHYGHEPWYWYTFALINLVGPAVIFLPQGSRRSPFLATFCFIVLLSHSLISHKEIRFIYPILAPCITLAAMGLADNLQALKKVIPFLQNPNWLTATGIGCLLISSAALAHRKAEWTNPNWASKHSIA